MKSVLRSPALALTALATITLSLSACSGAEDTELATSNAGAIDDTARASTDATGESVAADSAPQQAEPTARSEQAQSSPRVRGCAMGNAGKALGPAGVCGLAGEARSAHCDGMRPS